MSDICVLGDNNVLIYRTERKSSTPRVKNICEFPEQIPTVF